MPKILAIVSNGISASMLQSELTRRNLSFSDVYLISGRRLTHPWTSQCAGYIVFDKVPSLSFLGQINTLGFYRQAVKALKQWLRDPDLAHILIANTDNLLANHALRWAERHPAVTVGVLVEGNMNFHEVTRKNRAWWRWWVKPPMAAVFGLRYRSPVGHLSGAFEPRVNEVITYSEKFLHAPPEKIVVLPFPQVERKVTPDPDAVLVLVTGIGQWMKEADFETFKAGFARWVRSLGASKIWVKLHPNYPSGGIEDGIGPFEYFDDPRGIEVLAGEMPAQRIVGYWTTGLVTLKLIRPDLDCIDFGNDFYSRAAYHGDANLARVLEAGGVELVNFAPWAVAQTEKEGAA